MSEQLDVEFSGDRLPPGWIEVPLGSISQFINGDRGPNYPTKRHYVDEGIPFINAGHLVGERVDLSEMNFITEERFDLLRSGKVEDGDVIYCLRGSLGKAAIVRGLRRGAIASSLVIIRPTPSTDPRYILAFLVGPQGKALIKEHDNGSAQPNLAGRSVKKFGLPLAPLSEQRRIIAEIETQFTRLDDAVATLERVQHKLKRARASVLKAAVEGRLVPTEAEVARAEGRTYEPADVLLTRILEERRRKHDEAQAGSGRKKKYKEPVVPDEAGLPELPEGWSWSTMDVFLTTIEAGKSFRCDPTPPTTADQVGIVKVSAVTWGTYDESESKTVDDPSRVNPDYFIEVGDFLFSRANTIELVGACVLVGRTTRRTMLSDKILRLVPVQSTWNPWLLWVLRSLHGREQIESLATGNQDSMRNIGQGRIRQIVVPVPPAPERSRIVEEIERRLSVLDAIESTLRGNLQRCAALRQSILKRAFEGKLVPQDPNDEPASDLLARIQASA